MEKINSIVDNIFNLYDLKHCKTSEKLKSDYIQTVLSGVLVDKERELQKIKDMYVIKKNSKTSFWKCYFKESYSYLKNYYFILDYGHELRKLRPVFIVPDDCLHCYPTTGELQFVFRKADTAGFVALSDKEINKMYYVEQDQVYKVKFPGKLLYEY